MLSTTQLQPRNWKLKIVAATLTLAFGSFGASGDGTRAAPDNSAKSGSAPASVYGETPQPNQVRQNYLVFARQSGKVVGAFYTPRSEFTCFIGSQTTNQSLAVEPLASSGAKAGKVQVKLSNLHPIQPSSNDQRILSACKQTVELADK